MTIVRRSMTMLAGVLGAGAALIGFSACAPGFDAVRLSPSLYPTFQYSVPDYVNRCNPNTPTSVQVSAPANTTIEVAGQGAKGGNYTTQVNQQENEAFTIVVRNQAGAVTSTHHVRCLPRNFPQWEAARDGAPQAEFYATVIIEGFTDTNQPVIFDTNGVPVWWSKPGRTFLNTPLPNGNLATMPPAGTMVETRLDGSVARVLDTTTGPSDFHDVIVLPNGNYVMASLENRACNLTSWGQSATSKCLFHTFQELTPAGQVVWEWHAEDDVSVNETAQKWRAPGGGGVFDPWHYNSVEWTGDGFIVSFRHMDAIYKIDYATKNVVWKLGGSSTPQRLAVQGDPFGGAISGQHDARVAPGSDGSANVYDVTLFDNGSQVGRAPRSVRYRITESLGRADFIARVTDGLAPNSACCGSTRLLPTGNYVTGWGGTPWFTENQPNGAQAFRLDANFIYRAIPIMPGFYTRQQLRDGMDAQFNGPTPVTAQATAAREGSSDLADQTWRLDLGGG